MALIVCPNCGKRITDRTEVCPHCKTVLAQEKETPLVTKAEVLSDGKKHLRSAAIATVEAFAFTLLVGINLGVVCAVFLGKAGTTSFIKGGWVFQSRMLVVLSVGLIAQCIIPAILEKIANVKNKISVIILSVVLAFVFGLSYADLSSIYQILANAKDIHGYNVFSPEFIYNAAMAGYFYLITTPLYQGIFCLLNQDTQDKKGYISQAIFAGIALVLTVILAFIGAGMLCMGTQGAVFAGALAALIMLVLAGMRKK